MKLLNLGELYTYINTIANKDQLGEQFSPDKFALLLITTNSSYYNDEYQKVLALINEEVSKLEVQLFNNTPMFRFIKTKKYNLGNVENTLFDSPTDYGRTITGTAFYNNIWRPMKFLSVTEFNTRRFNIVTKSMKRMPIFTERAGGFEVVPHAVRRLTIDYLRAVKDPVFDYCVGVIDDNEYYMPPGSKLKKDGKFVGLYDEDGILIVDNVEHLSDPQNYPYLSTSVELDWDEEDKVIISDIIIAASGVRSREFELANAASKSSE